jgi:hypothetical protein
MPTDLRWSLHIPVASASADVLTEGDHNSAGAASDPADDGDLVSTEKRIDQNIASLEQSVASLERRIASLKADLEALYVAKRAISARAANSQVDSPADLGPDPARRGRWKHGSDAQTLRNFVKSALLRLDRPLKRPEILRLLKEAGIEIGAKDPLRRITKVMWEADEFVSTRDGYWLANRPLPER